MSSNRVRLGFKFGVLATIAMSIPMVIATVVGVSPLPAPIPKAVVGTLVSGAVSKPFAMALAVGSHLAYGGVSGAVLARSVRPVTAIRGLGLGVALWVIAGLSFLPFLGWGVFGTAVTPKIAVATLVPHLVYGATLGLALDRRPAETMDGPASTAD